MKKLIASVLLLMPALLPAQEKLSLQQAVETGLKNNYDVRIAKNNAEQSANNATLGNAGALPQLNLGLTQTNSVNDTKQKYASGAEVNKNGAASNSLAGTAALSWTIFDGFKMFATYSRLKELEDAGQLQARQMMENTVSQIIVAYYDIIKQQALLAVIDSSIKISDIKLTIAKTKFRIGSYSKTEYLQAQVDKNADALLYKKQLLALSAARVLLNRLLARDVTVEFDAVDSITVNYNPTYQELMANAAKNNVSLLLADKDIGIANYYIKELQGERFPRLALTGNYNYSKSTSQANFVLENRTQGFNYGFTVTYNLFDGFNLNSRIKNAKLQADNRKIYYEAVKSTVNAETIIAYRTFQSNLDILKLEEENAKLAQENVLLTLERYRVGTIDELQLKNAQQSYTQAQTSLATAKYNTKVAETNLKLLTGELIK